MFYASMGVRKGVVVMNANTEIKREGKRDK
jgi:hypothetical protein